MFKSGPESRDRVPSDLAQAYLADEDTHVNRLLESLQLDADTEQSITGLATSLVTRVRASQSEPDAVDAFMQQYDLSSEEGVLLMCLAEALLRVPDSDTADRLIADKIGSADWESHLGKSRSLFVNASTWGLMLTGKMVRVPDTAQRDLMDSLRGLVTRSGEPVIRNAVRQAMRIIGHQYVMGRTIKEAVKRSRQGDNKAYRYSFDMLGEAALTAADADRYYESYAAAIGTLGQDGPYPDLFAAPSISVKLSALHPRYEIFQKERVMQQMAPRVAKLARLARQAGVAMTIDAEEADRLQLSLDLMQQVFADPGLAGWDGLGLVVQAYQKRAPFVIDWLYQLGQSSGRRLPIRLVKGAYWDTEIKHAQEQGLPGYPVFTRKLNTDLSYLACAQTLLQRRDVFYPQFATHNAHSLAAVYHLAGDDKGFEFQRLHGMGEELYAEVVGADKLDMPCRVYAPVGSHEDLLPYLVRRLLENGANTSFVNRIVDAKLPVADIVADPVVLARGLESKAHPRIPAPRDLFGGTRLSGAGINLADEYRAHELAAEMARHPAGQWSAAPLVPGSTVGGDARPVQNPADNTRVIGQWRPASRETVELALANATAAQPGWNRVSVDQRASCLERAADAMEQRQAELMSLLLREAGKTAGDAVAEIREAVDFCRYYAAAARQAFAPVALPGPTGESNELRLHGRGVFVCISPWNFPLAIFTGQVVAALVTGNTVLAKPAEQTNLVAAAACDILHAAGIPPEVLQLLPGEGASVGAQLTGDPRVAGVAFTGSTETARLISQSLSRRDGPLATLIAETGGQNVMLADSSALPEQLVGDVVASAFLSAGQRCSALRVLMVQRDVADKVLTMLEGAMAQLQVGDPALLSTDVGPVIDAGARQVLLEHCRRMDSEARLIGRSPLPEWAEQGHFVAPVAYEINSLDQLEREVFGPVLHVLRYRARDLDQVVDAVNATGYGLTLGIHSRIESTVERIRQRSRVGNLYVNRNMVGAVVGVQPFGGEGLSGTGPKAGGPHYLHRFCTERTVTVNTAAVGGNASLLAMEPARS
ncbi:MAG: bifunctional proline dehydrogenase/L-glutamate gamma-semialdehyde dehydrogenase PutA [Xanthomonadales bacterium]|nr:bifunctional proline dehydrogenase/L-glutamate gamma-semialdehyde dehydrogenase PutA [Xanthomonadales bacterium]